MRMIAAFLVVATLALSPVARADDDPGLADGGSVVTSTDGGSTVTVLLPQGAKAWTMAIRCEGAQSVRYRLCASSTCAVSQHNQLLDYDSTQDIGVNQSGATKRYLSLATDDAGIPFCKVQENR